MFRLSVFRNRVERSIVLVVLVLGLLPLAGVAVLAMQEIEKQTLTLAQQQLRDSTKTYALDLLNQLARAEAEIRLLYLSGLTPDETYTIEGFSIVESDVKLKRTVLALGRKSLLVQVPQQDVVLIGAISFDVLFAGLGHVPYGVERCILLDETPVTCHGSPVADAAEAIEAAWDLPLSSVYDTSIQLKVTSSQLVKVALQHLNLISTILPLTILLAALLIGWGLMRHIRRLVSPLSDLEEATLSVRDGNYDKRVALNTGDEFEKLGKAFNLMTDRLSNSFQKMQALGEIDRLILSGATTEDVIRHALLLAGRSCSSPCSVYLRDEMSDVLFELRDEVLHQSELALDAATEQEVLSPEALAAAMGKRLCNCFRILREGSLLGYLLVAEGEALSQVESRTLAELADRISVAMTNASRAQALYQQANYDVLTGLINRQSFNDRLKERIEAARRRNIQGALLFLDLDRFKQVNDTEGHLTGDQLLREVAHRLTDGLRSTDIVARLGGDEFAVIFPEVKNSAELTHLCERLIAAVRRPFVLDNISHPVDVSVGVSVFPDDGVEPGSLLRKADVAMYKAKEQKGSAFAFFDESLNRATEVRVAIENRLRRVMEEKRLELHFQPKLNLRTGRIEQVEGLIRWPADDLDVLSPDQFVPIAEDTGLIHDFTRLLVEQSAACLQMSKRAGLGLKRVAINISAQQFSRIGFADSLLQELANCDLKADRIELELTESVFIDDTDQIVGELVKLRSAGVHVALDDFGTGYSSLNLLRSLPLNAIKIDRSFITPLTSSDGARDMAIKIVEIARLLQLEVVAEGVEEQAEMDLLRDIGCDMVQGYFISRALPLDALEAFLGTRRKERTSGEVIVLNRR